MNIYFLIASFVSLFTVVGTETIEVPMHLDPVFRAEGWILGFMLFVAFLLLALAKRLEPQIMGMTIRSFFTLGTPESLQKFEVRFNSTGFILLGFHSFISLLVCLTLFIQDTNLLEGKSWFVSEYDFSGFKLSITVLLINFLLIVYNFIGLFIVSILTGEGSLIRIFTTQSWVNFLFFGIVFFLLAVVWLLNPSISYELFYVFIYVLIAFFFFRFVKVLIASLLEGVPWYYIILYLCTLEILPLVVLYHYIA
jgi:hypothetical protein